MIIATAPGRCGIVGNPTDMYGGSVISCSTREHAICRLIPETDDISITVSGTSKIISSVEDMEMQPDDILNVALAALQALEIDPASTPPFHLETNTNIPMQAGLAGSTAILATIIGCLLEHMDLRLGPYETSELIRKIEYDVIGTLCGFQDHYMTVFGGINYMDFREKYSDEPQEPSSPFATIEPLANYIQDIPLILAHTGVKHHSGRVHKNMRTRWIEGDKDVIEAFIEVARLARGGKKALIAGDWEALGDVMNRNHSIVRELGGSGEMNDKLIKTATTAGALGAKLAGAGGGGTIIALAPNKEKVEKALRDAGAESIFYPEPLPGLTVEVRI